MFNLEGISFGLRKNAGIFGGWGTANKAGAWKRAATGLRRQNAQLTSQLGKTTDKLNALRNRSKLAIGAGAGVVGGMMLANHLRDSNNNYY